MVKSTAVRSQSRLVDLEMGSHQTPQPNKPLVSHDQQDFVDDNDDNSTSSPDRRERREKKLPGGKFSVNNSFHPGPLARLTAGFPRQRGLQGFQEVPNPRTSPPVALDFGIHAPLSREDDSLNSGDPFNDSANKVWLSIATPLQPGQPAYTIKPITHQTAGGPPKASQDLPIVKDNTTLIHFGKHLFDSFDIADLSSE
ncbi:hypothetical protein BsWGS_17013 [Bradybaena similaris]